MEMTSDDHLGTQELLEVPHDTKPIFLDRNLLNWILIAFITL